jgi:hypothetical protein
MTVNVSDYLKFRLLTTASGNSSWNLDNARYIWLFNDVDNNLEFQLNQGASYLAAELTALDYEPKEVFFNGEGSNTAVSFPPAESNWGRITHIAVFGQYNQHCFFWKRLPEPIEIFTGDIISFPFNYLKITLT